jgi:Fur family transcriptional regulator, zinc uptake regulator
MTDKPSKRPPPAEQDKLIVAALKAAGRPVSAYEIIDRIRGDATLAPQTVYRALDRLISAGVAHRLESLNAFVACAHAAHRGTAIFAICETCNAVREFDEASAVKALQVWADKTDFSVRQMTLELRGRCAACAGADG